MMRSRWVGIALFLLSACEAPRINQSAEYFLPPELGAHFHELQGFPGAWWNYVVVEHPTAKLCLALKAEPGLSRVGCYYGPGDFRDLLRAWVHDLPLRESPPSGPALRAKMALAMAKASAPLGSNVVELLRLDPLASYEGLSRLLLSLNPVRLEYRDDFLRFPGVSRAAIPMLFEFSHEETARTAAVLARIKEACGTECGEIVTIGAHFGTERNKRVIMADMQRVSWLGTALFAVFLTALSLTGRLPALLVVIPVSLGVGTAVWAVNAWNGSIHGLTIAFGSSLTGIALDYAFHAFVRDSGAKVWHANFVGYLTTIAVFAVMAFSGIPLVREIMLFAIVGVTVAIALFYAGLRGLPQRWRLAPFGARPFPVPAARGFLAIACLALAVSAFFLRPDFSLQSMEQSTPRERAVTRELFSTGGARPPVVRILPAGAPEEEFAKEAELARANGVRLVNRFTFLPLVSVRARNLAAWRSAACVAPGWGLTEEERKFFAPFLELAGCDALAHLEPGEEGPYTKAIRGNGGQWLSTFFPSNAGQEAALKALPGAFSLREIAELFPLAMAWEMSWMAPLAMLLVALIVWLSYRSWRVTLAVFIPWFVGAAFASVGFALSPTGFGFVSLVGVLMVFGIATDFGVFCANYYINSELTRHGIWSALLLASTVSILGFVPLLFADHIVLRQLGEPLVLGTLGVLFGTFFVQPWWMRYALGN